MAIILFSCKYNGKLTGNSVVCQISIFRLVQVFKPEMAFENQARVLPCWHLVKYVQLNFYSSIIKIKASYASMESVSHAEFWNSAAFRRMEEWSREILRTARDLIVQNVFDAAIRNKPDDRNQQVQS